MSFLRNESLFFILAEEKEIIKNTKPNSFAYLSDQLIGIVVGAVGIPILLLVAIVVFCLICHRQIKYKDGANKLSGNDQTIKHNLADSFSNIPLKKFSTNGNGYSYNNIMHDTEKVFYNGSLTTNLHMPSDTVGRESCKTVQTRQLPEIPKIPVESAGGCFNFSLFMAYVVEVDGAFIAALTIWFDQ